MVLKTHEEDIERYERLLATRKDVLERALVVEMLDTLKKHLKVAKRMKEKKQVQN